MTPHPPRPLLVLAKLKGRAPAWYALARTLKGEPRFTEPGSHAWHKPEKLRVVECAGNDAGAVDVIENARAAAV